MKHMTRCLIIFVIGILLASCSLPRRQQVEIAPFNQKVTIKSPESIAIKFEESVLGKPLNETVWDNVSGPFWNIEESTQIGFTQNYKPQFFAIPPVLLPVAAEGGANLINTQIVIPFGRIFTGVFESALRKYTPSVTACMSDACIRSAPTANILSVKIDQFIVWEAPLNHLNLYAKGTSNYFIDGKNIETYHFERSILSHKLGSVFSTHAGFMRAMNKVSNQFAEDLSADILMNAF